MLATFFMRRDAEPKADACRKRRASSSGFEQEPDLKRQQLCDGVQAPSFYVLHCQHLQSGMLPALQARSAHCVHTPGHQVSNTWRLERYCIALQAWGTRLHPAPIKLAVQALWQKSRRWPPLKVPRCRLRRRPLLT